MPATSGAITYKIVGFIVGVAATSIGAYAAIDSRIEKAVEDHGRRPHIGAATKEDVQRIREDIAELRQLLLNRSRR